MLSHGMCTKSYISLKFKRLCLQYKLQGIYVARVNRRGGTKCNDVHHQPEGTVACFCGSHGGGEWQTWHGSRRSIGPTRTRTRTNPLRVRPLHCYRPTVQRRPVSQSGFSPAPHRRFQALPCSGSGLPGDPCGGPGQRCHGRRGHAECPTPADR